MEKFDILTICFNGKHHFVREFQFRKYAKKKRPIGSNCPIDGSSKKPTYKTELAKWKTHDDQIVSWILGLANPNMGLNIRSYKIARDVWCYLKCIIIKKTLPNNFSQNLKLLNFMPLIVHKPNPPALYILLICHMHYLFSLFPSYKNSQCSLSNLFANCNRHHYFE